MRTRPTFALALGLSSLTCTSARPARVEPAPTTAPPTAAESPPAPSAGSVARVVPRVPAVPERARVFLAATEPDGTRDVVIAGLRARVTPSGVSIAGERFARGLISATPVDDGWVFVSEDGVAAKSATFGGTLAAVPGLECGTRLQAARPSRGRVLVRQRASAKWWSLAPGAGAFREWVPAFAAPPLAVAFGDGTHGAAILDGGAVVRTDDGGARWSSVDLGGGSAMDVAALDGGLVLTSPGARVALALDGSVHIGPTTRALLAESWGATQADVAAVRAAATSARASVFSGGCPDPTEAELAGDATQDESGGYDPAGGDDDTDEYRERNFGLQQWDCGYAGRRVHAPMAYPSLERSPGSGRRTATLDLGNARVDVVQRGNSPAVARAVWRGPGRGFATREIESPLPLAHDADAEDDSQLHGGVLALTPQGMLFFSADPGTYGNPRLFRATDGGGIEPLATPPGASLEGFGAQPATLPLPDGAAAVFDFIHEYANEAGVGTPESRYAAVWTIAPDATVRGRREYAFAPGGTLGLARYHGSVGVLSVDGGQAPAMRFYPLDAAQTAPVALGPLPRALAGTCRHPLGADDVEVLTSDVSDTLLYVADQSAVIPDSPGFAGVDYVTLEVGPRGACVREVAGGRDLREFGGSHNESVRLLARGANLVGQVDDGTSRTGARCVPHREENLRGINIPE